MNVVGSRPDGWWRDRRAAMERLTSLLDAFAAETGDPLTVVFDGAPFDLSPQSVEVAFATGRGPNAADHDIAAGGEQDPGPQTPTGGAAHPPPAPRRRGGGARGAGRA